MTKKRKRLIALIRLMFLKSGLKKAKYLKKKNLFGEFGEKNYWYSRNLPSEPENVYIHNNVKVATDVYFCTHDVIHLMLNDCPEYMQKLNENSAHKKFFNLYKGDIEIFDNVFIGAKSVIMYNTKIGPNAIVASGSVVTKDVLPNTIVGGAPAKVIGTFDDYVQRRPEFKM